MKNDTSKRKRSPILTFEHPLKIEVYVPEFEPLSAIDFLDAGKLSNGDHRVEIGFFKGGCCKKLVHAVIKNGMVVGIEAERCEDSEEEVSEEILTLFSHVAKKLEHSEHWKPVPVEEFLIMAKDGSYPPRAGTGAGCFYICLWHYCLFCCLSTATSSFPTCWIERRKPDVEM